MAANGDTGPFIDIFSQIIKAHFDTLNDDQKKTLIEVIMSQLSTPTSSPSPASNPMPPSTPPQNRTPYQRRLDRVRARRTQGRKAVNAFMVFRSYYSSLLRGLPQKARSPMLGRMWRSEKRQSLFNLLGVAYSRIRDGQMAPDINLEMFLQVATKAVPIIPAHDYFQKSGWTLIGQELYCNIVDETAVEAEYPLQTNLSPKDLLNYCVQQGLVSQQVASSAVSTQDHGHIGNSIAFAAPPQVNVASLDDGDSVMSFPDFNSIDVPLSPESWPLTEAQLFDTPSPLTNYTESLTTITANQQQTYDQTPAVLHWNPQISPPILNFDPTVIQDPFDPFTFDIDQYCNTQE